MVVLEIENQYGDTLSIIRIIDNKIDKDHIKVIGCFDVADIDNDNIFNSNDIKVRLQANDEVEFYFNEECE